MAAPIRTPPSKWTEQGLRALADGGPEAVRIELLARALGVTKGSFYGHFDGRQALMDEMLDAWEQRVVDEPIARVEGDEDADARARLRRLFALGVELGPDLMKTELAIRDWARRDKSVARRLRRVDNRRMDYMRSLFGGFCEDDAEVEVRCLVAFSLFIGTAFIAAEHGPRTRPEVIELALERLLA